MSGPFTDTPLSVPTATPTPRVLPPFHVILLDDDDHTYVYVIKMLMELFGHTKEQAFAIAEEVDSYGRGVVWTGQKEWAEVHRSRIHSMGADQLLERSYGCMSAIIEPAS